jgi:hypothetical protein
MLPSVIYFTTPTQEGIMKNSPFTNNRTSITFTYNYQHRTDTTTSYNTTKFSTNTAHPMSPPVLPYINTITITTPDTTVTTRDHHHNNNRPTIATLSPHYHDIFRPIKHTSHAEIELSR